MVSLFPIQLNEALVSKKSKVILGPVSAQIKAGGPTVVIGPNGAGKTTLLRLIHGLERAREGDVTFAPSDQSKVYKKQCFVFQKPIMLRRSALDNVAYPLILDGVKKAQAREQAHQMIERIGLGGVASTQATYLSGGESQKLAIARALITNPDLLILDEPTASLDASATRDIEALIVDAAKSGIEIMMTTQHMGQARRLAKKIIFVHKGQLLEMTEAKSFWNGPKSDEALRFINGEIV